MSVAGIQAFSLWLGQGHCMHGLLLLYSMLEKICLKHLSEYSSFLCEECELTIGLYFLPSQVTDYFRGPLKQWCMKIIIDLLFTLHVCPSSLLFLPRYSYSHCEIGLSYLTHGSKELKYLYIW